MKKNGMKKKVMKAAKQRRKYQRGGRFRREPDLTGIAPPAKVDNTPKPSPSRAVTGGPEEEAGTGIAPPTRVDTTPKPKPTPTPRNTKPKLFRTDKVVNQAKEQVSKQAQAPAAQTFTAAEPKIDVPDKPK